MCWLFQSMTVSVWATMKDRRTEVITEVFVLNDAFTYWWLIMLYQELIALHCCLIKHGMKSGHRALAAHLTIITAISTCPCFIPFLICCSFWCHDGSISLPIIVVLKALRHYSFIEKTGLMSSHSSFFINQSTYLSFSHPVFIFLLLCLFYALEHLHFSCIPSPSLWLILCSHLHTPDLEQLARLSLFPLHPFTPPFRTCPLPCLWATLSSTSLSAPSQPLPLFYLWEYADGANPGKDRFFLVTGWKLKWRKESGGVRVKEQAQLITDLSFVLKSKAIHQKQWRENKKWANKGERKSRERNMYHKIYARSNWVSGK